MTDDNEKIVYTAGECLIDSFRLGIQIYRSGFRPSFILGLWRGGAPVAMAVDELFRWMGHTAYDTPIKTKSYDSIMQQDMIDAGCGEKKVNVEIKGVDHVIREIQNRGTKEKILLADDVHDTGLTLKRTDDFITLRIEELGLEAPEIRIATPCFKPGKNKTGRKPDYYVWKTDAWVIYPHELAEGLGDDDLRSKGNGFFELFEPYLRGAESQGPGFVTGKVFWRNEFIDFDSQYVDMDLFSRHAFELAARKVWDSGYRPDILISLWRSGSPTAIVIDEFHRLMYERGKSGKKMYNTAVKTASLQSILGGKETFEIKGLGHVIREMKRRRDEDGDCGFKILVVDDMLNTGRTMKRSVDEIYRQIAEEVGEVNVEIRTAVTYQTRVESPEYTPDYCAYLINKRMIHPFALMASDMRTGERRKLDYEEAVWKFDRMKGQEGKTGLEVGEEYRGNKKALIKEFSEINGRIA